MKKILPIVLFFCGFVMSNAVTAKPVFTDMSGQVVNIDHPGKRLYLNFWAPWCGSCKEELSAFNQFYAKHAGKVLVYGVNYDQPTVDELKEVTKKMHVTYPQLVQDPSTHLNLGVTALPMTFVYSPEGKYLRTLVGPQTLSDLEASLDEKHH